MPEHAKVYVSLVIAAGVAAMAYAFLDPPWSHDVFRFGVYLALSLLAAGLKLRLPGITGTMSVGFVFILLGISEMTLAETMLVGCMGIAVQCVWRAKVRPTVVQVLFNMSAMAVSLVLAYESVNLVRTQLHVASISVALAVATCLYFTANSLLVSGVLALLKRERLHVVWQQCYLYAFPYYLLGGAVAGLMAASGHEYGWKPPLLILPVMGLAFLFYRLHLARLDLATLGGTRYQREA